MQDIKLTKRTTVSLLQKDFLLSPNQLLSNLRKNVNVHTQSVKDRNEYTCGT